MSNIKKVFQWIVYSSTDPSKIALTVKGVGGSVITVLIILAGITHVQLQSADLTAILDGIVQTITALLGVVSAFATVYGAVRKVWITVSGQHPQF